MDTFLVAVLAIIFLIYVYYKMSFQYWKKRGIATINPSFPFGDIGLPFAGQDGLVLKMAKFHQQFKAKGAKMGGLYAGTKPALLVVHPDAIKTVLSKNFNNFNGHGTSFNEEAEPLEAHLFNLEGKRWKDMRVKMTPTFTSGKMKMMFETLLDCGKQLEEFIDKCQEQNKELDIKEILACYTTDVIGSCAFGIDCNSFKDPDAEFRTYGRKLFAPSLKFQIRIFFTMVSPYLVKLLKMHFTQKDASDFFLGSVKHMINYRQSNNVTRNDFMQILMNMEEKAKENGQETYTIEQLAAQAYVFYLAGFETSSTTMTFCFYELAYHQDIQDKLRQEIRSVIKKHKGKLTYDGIMEMKYLDQVLNETLRKYPPVHTLPRICTQNYKLPNGTEIEKGTSVFISVFGLHRDEDYFPSPDKFDPDRFSDKNKHNIVPFSYIPFGEGPRMCIGLRFGMMQAKVGLCLMIKNYKVFPHESIKYPLKIDRKTPILTAEGAILLTTQKA